VSWDNIVSVAPHCRLGGQGKNPCGAKFSAHIQTSPGAQPSSYKTGTASFPGVNGINDPPHLALASRLKKE
jgi:hypothetical protein